MRKCAIKVRSHYVRWMSRATRKEYEIRHFTGGAGPKKCPKLSDAEEFLVESNKMLKEFKRGKGKIWDMRVSKLNGTA